jgi:NADH dehydrogenase
VAPHVVIIGGGFGGLSAARALARAKVRVTLVDRENHHLFQPLLYQVATASLAATDISAPIRSILSRQKNTNVLLEEVKGFDLDGRRVLLDDRWLDYDYLIVAAGAETSYFGHDEWQWLAPSLKSLEGALEIRRRVLLAYEIAEREQDLARRRELMNFVVIGGGPTGVELAGALAELSRHVLEGDFRNIDPCSSRVFLVEAGDRLVPTFRAPLPEKAASQLTELGVELRIGARVVGVDARGVTLSTGELLSAATIIWAAGVRPSALGAMLGVPCDRAGRVIVGTDLAICDHPEVFVVGDLACFMQNEKPLPGLSPVAMQEGRAAARAIKDAMRGRPRTPFRYFDKGALATIGRKHAIADLRHVKLWGWIAWVAWVTVHIWFLIGFRNRLVVMINWAWSYVTFKRGARLIVGSRQPAPELAIEHAPSLPSPAPKQIADGERQAARA